MNKLTKALALIGSSAATSLAMAGVALAGSNDQPIKTIPVTGEISASFNLQKFFSGSLHTIVNIVFVLASVAAIVYLIWAGIKYITAGGDAKKAQEARTAIVNAVIGIAVVIGAYTLINIAFGINNSVTKLQDNGEGAITNTIQ